MGAEAHGYAPLRAFSAVDFGLVAFRCVGDDFEVA